VRSFTSHSKRKTLGPNKSAPARRRERRIELINSATGDVIGVFDDVVAAFRANAQFQRQQEGHTITIIKEVN
jgi:hypothetical protein